MCTVQLYLTFGFAVAVPAALVLSADHRKHFLSTLVMLITGQSVRSGSTDSKILFTILRLLSQWLSDPSQSHLTFKELLVILQRVAQMDRLHAIPVHAKAKWDKAFLSMLYFAITRHSDKEFSTEVFNRVERTFCCGLQSRDYANRKKVLAREGGGCPGGSEQGPQQLACAVQFFRLYADRLPLSLFEHLRYIIQVQARWALRASAAPLAPRAELMPPRPPPNTHTRTGLGLCIPHFLAQARRRPALRLPASRRQSVAGLQLCSSAAH